MSAAVPMRTLLRFCAFGLIWSLSSLSVEGTPLDKEAFRQWLIERGTEFQAKLEFGVDKSTGLRGLLAAEPIVADAPLFSLPKKMVLTFDIAKAQGATWSRCETTKIGEESEWLSPVHSVLALFLLEQRAAGASWHPWVSSLPSSDFEGNFPLFYGEEVLAEFQASPLRRVIKLDQNAVENDYALAAKAWPGLTIEEFRWARIMVKSRVFGLRSLSGKKLSEEVIAMVPLADFVNHPPDDAGTKPNAAPSYDPETGTFSLKATTSIAAGEGIYWDYGFRSNRGSLLRYGFTSQKRVALTDMPLFFKLNVFSSSTKDAAKELKLAHIAEAQRTGELAMDPDGSVMHELSLALVGKNAERLLGHMRFQVFQPSDAVSLTNLCPGTYCRPISLSNERQALQQLSAVVQELGDSYTSSVAEDKDLLDSGKLSPADGARWHAVVVRYGEKHILRGMGNIVRAIDPLFDKNPRSLKEEIAKRWNNDRSDVHQYVKMNLTSLVELEAMHATKDKQKEPVMKRFKK